MIKRLKTVVVLCVVVGILLYSLKWWFFPVIYPTESSSRHLTIVRYSGFLRPNRPVITLKHFLDEHHLADYVLTIENGISEQEPQRYRLPKIKEGKVEVTLEFGDRINDSLKVVYNQASEMYKKGLLIYLQADFSNFSSNIHGDQFYDRYACIVSGKNKICLFREKYSTEWTEIVNGPKLERIPRKYEPNSAGYIPTYSGWKENEWIVINKVG